jgi:hypothetical protein
MCLAGVRKAFVCCHFAVIECCQARALQLHVARKAAWALMGALESVCKVVGRCRWVHQQPSNLSAVTPHH